jgi:hypothetical protein
MKKKKRTYLKLDSISLLFGLFRPFYIEANKSQYWFPPENHGDKMLGEKFYPMLSKMVQKLYIPQQNFQNLSQVTNSENGSIWLPDSDSSDMNLTGL